MTTIEVLEEIKKMQPAQKRRVLNELNSQIGEQRPNGRAKKQKKFIEAMRKKGSIIEIPLGLPDDERRRNFKPILITGEPISETIIRERR